MLTPRTMTARPGQARESLQSQLALGGWEGGDFHPMCQNLVPACSLPALSHSPQAAVPWQG